MKSVYRMGCSCGFGDVVPKNDIGRAIALVMMQRGWDIPAVLTKFINSEITMQHGLRVPPPASVMNAFVKDMRPARCSARLR